jgi:selenoprotein W-related protein
VRDRIAKKSQADINLVKSSGGVFEIKIDGELVFSKRALGRFPTDEEVDNLI